MGKETKRKVLVVLLSLAIPIIVVLGLVIYTQFQYLEIENKTNNVISSIQVVWSGASRSYEDVKPDQVIKITPPRFDNTEIIVSFGNESKNYRFYQLYFESAKIAIKETEIVRETK